MSRRHPDLRSLDAASGDVRTAPTFAIADLPSCKGGQGMSRREFCAIAGAGLGLLGLAACDPGAARIVVGDGVDNTGTNPNTSNGPPVGDGAVPIDEDLAHPPGSDLASGPHDMAMSSGSCSGPYDAGPASAITTGQAKYITDNNNFALFLCRDASGLYALSAICPHQGEIIQKKTSEFYCPAHGATFDLNGQHPTYPAFSALDHYALCVDATGNVLIDYNKTVSASTRA